MSTTENPLIFWADNQSRELGISRNVKSWGYDSELKKWVVVVEVLGHHRESQYRTETKPFFMRQDNAEGAINNARALAILDFLGVKAEQVAAPKPAEEIKEQAEIVPSVPKTRKPRKSKEEAPAVVEEKHFDTIPPVIEEAPTTVEDKPKKSTNIPYDSSIQAHKILLASHLNKSPEYRKDWAADIASSREFSQKVLHGMDFLDDSGNMLQSFKDKLVEKYGVK